MAATNAKWAILAYLRQHSTHGYMVFRQIGERFPSWGTSRSTVFDHLARLERDGLIDEVPEEPTNLRRRSRGRTTYALSKRGADALDSFLGALDLTDAPREYFVLALLCATQDGPKVTLRLLDDLEQRVMARLDEIRPAPRPTRLTELGAWGLVKDEQHALNARLTWIDTMRQATQELTGGAGASP